MRDFRDIFERANKTAGRRSFLTRAGGMGVGAALLMSGAPAIAAIPGPEDDHEEHGSDNGSGDTAQEIFTAALIAEDLATTFYYNGLTGGVIMDPNLAGTGGTATHVASNGNEGNVDYLRAALSEEITHANLLRSLTGGSNPQNDPYQTFYFPTGTFDTLGPFLAILDALENAFIGAYLNATAEFAQMAADTKAEIAFQVDPMGKRYSSRTLEYYAEVAASIMGVESEHRVLGRVISNTNPANQLCFEQTDGLTSVYNGNNSAVVALTPFLKTGSGKTPYSLQAALQGSGNVSLPCTGGLPAEQPAPPERD